MALEELSEISNVATAIGVAVAAWQLLVTRRQAVSSFEDSLTSQYRSLVKDIPLPALLGEPISEGEMEAALPHFYRYFDLCNEQVFLFHNGRISKKTWVNWEEGIRTNLYRPAFADAWAQIAARADLDFSHLRELCPPGKWVPRAG